jgi:hypothetical protein
MFEEMIDRHFAVWSTGARRRAYCCSTCSLMFELPSHLSPADIMSLLRHISQHKHKQVSPHVHIVEATR